MASKKIRLSNRDKTVIRLLLTFNMNVTEVAREMCYSRQSIYNFVKKITEKTGLNPLDIQNLLDLKQKYCSSGE